MWTGLRTGIAAIVVWALVTSLARAADAPTSIESATDSGIAVLDRVVAPMTGDLDVMRKLGRVRVLVSFSRTNFFVAEGRARGFDCDLMSEYQRAPAPAAQVAAGRHDRRLRPGGVRPAHTRAAGRPRRYRGGWTYRYARAAGARCLFRPISAQRGRNRRRRQRGA